jgi:hypothetical protein
MNTTSCTAAHSRRAATRRERLAVTLLVTVAVKCLLLYGLWYACFSHPQTRHMLLPADQVERHLFATPVQDTPVSRVSNLPSTH